MKEKINKKQRRKKKDDIKKEVTKKIEGIRVE